MRARLLLDQFADESQLTEAQRALVTWKHCPRHRQPVAIFPKGAEFDGPQALALCRTGQAAPSDDECAKALGMTAEQMEQRQIEYRMDNLGINNPEDRKLYRAGVILGYDENLRYIRGPKWHEYQKAKQQVEEDDV